MRRHSVSGNTSPNAGFLFVGAESRSSTKVSPRFHYAQAQCFQSLFENTVQCGILVPQEGAVRMKLTCPGVSQPPPPNFNVVDSGVGSLKLKKSSLKLGEWGGVSGQEAIWIHSLARTSAFEWRLEKASGSSKVLGD